VSRERMVVLPGRRSKVLPAIGRPCRGRGIPRGAGAPLGLPQEPRRRRRHGSCFPRLVAVAPRPHARRVAPCFYSSPLDAARSKDGAGPRRLMLGTLAACLRFRRQLGRCRRSALLNVGPRLAAGSPVDTVEAAIAARFVPPVFSSSVLGGAREEEEAAD